MAELLPIIGGLSGLGALVAGFVWILARNSLDLRASRTEIDAANARANAAEQRSREARDREDQARAREDEVRRQVIQLEAQLGRYLLSPLLDDPTAPPALPSAEVEQL